MRYATDDGATPTRSKDASGVQAFPYRGNGSRPGVSLSSRVRSLTGSHTAIQRLHALVDTCPFPIVGLDRDAYVEVWNRAAEEMFGWSADEIQGQPLPSVPAEHYNHFCDSMLPVESGQPVHLKDVFSLCKDGRMLAVNISVAPIFDHAGKVSGSMAIMEDITDQKRIEREQARSAAALRRLEKNRALLLRRMIQTQEEERRWISQEIHDHAGQSMLAVSLGLKAIENGNSLEELRSAVGELRVICTDTLKQLTQLGRGLHTQIVEDLGLAGAIERYCKDFGEGFDISVKVSTQIHQDACVPRLVSTSLYRILQEAMANVRKHSGASEVVVKLTVTRTKVEMSVNDNGAGFEKSASVRVGNLGLTGMRERAEAVNGRFTVESGKGKGTGVRVAVPLGTTKCRTKKK